MADEHSNRDGHPTPGALPGNVVERDGLLGIAPSAHVHPTEGGGFERAADADADGSLDVASLQPVQQGPPAALVAPEGAEEQDAHPIAPARSVAALLRARELSQPPRELDQADAELLELAALVEDAVRVRVSLARRLVLDRDAPHVGTLDEAKSRAKRTLERILRSLGDLREEDGVLHSEAYRDARMVLTQAILWRAGICRSGGTQPTAEMAEGAGAAVAQLYPTLADAMAEPMRIERIREAIASAAASAKRISWKMIAATWDGIESGRDEMGRDPERWRKDWDEHRKNRP